MSIYLYRQNKEIEYTFMKLTLRAYSSLLELTVESGSTKITEDLSVYQGEDKYVADESVIENLLTIAFEMNRFKSKSESDLELVTKIFDAFLNDHEKDLFLEQFSKQD